MKGQEKFLLRIKVFVIATSEKIYIYTYKIAIIATQLDSTIHPSHILVVAYDALWAWHVNGYSITTQNIQLIQRRLTNCPG